MFYFFSVFFEVVSVTGTVKRVDKSIKHLCLVISFCLIIAQ